MSAFKKWEKLGESTHEEDGYIYFRSVDLLGSDEGGYVVSITDVLAEDMQTKEGEPLAFATSPTGYSSTVTVFIPRTKEQISEMLL